MHARPTKTTNKFEVIEPYTIAVITRFLEEVNSKERLHVDHQSPLRQAVEVIHNLKMPYHRRYNLRILKSR